MRILEITLLLVVTILPFVKRPLVRRTQPNYILLFIGILLALHVILEGWRWQMIPAYVLALIVAWRIKAVDATNPARLTFFRSIGYLSIIVLAFIGWILPMALPVFTLPEPTGAYHVGTAMMHIETEQEEQITEAPDDQRELMLKFWYPSEAGVSSLRGEKYVNDASRAGFATKYGLPPNALHYLDYVKTYAYADIPIADGPFPVLIFSHGYGSKASGYYAILSEMASQGYVIINMNHTYESLGVTFPDGREAYFDYEYQHQIAANSMERMQSVIDAFKNGLAYEQRHPIVTEAVKDYFEGDIQDRWAADILVVLDLLEQWNSAGTLQGKLDLDRIGVFGHSVGGGTAGNAAMRDSRLKAAANLDGIQWGEKIDTLHHIPYLYVSADWPAEHEDINAHIYRNKSTDYFYETKLLQSGHPNFMDIPFMIPVSAVAGTGDIDPYLGTEIVTKLLTAFFDKHLKNKPTADPQGIGAEYEQLEMTVYPGDSME